MGLFFDDMGYFVVLGTHRARACVTARMRRTFSREQLSYLTLPSDSLRRVGCLDAKTTEISNFPRAFDRRADALSGKKNVSSFGRVAFHHDRPSPAQVNLAPATGKISQTL